MEWMLLPVVIPNRTSSSFLEETIANETIALVFEMESMERGDLENLVPPSFASFLCASYVAICLLGVVFTTNPLMLIGFRENK